MPIVGDGDVALGGSDEGPGGVWVRKCFFGLFSSALKVSSALLVRDWSNFFSKAGVMSISNGLLSSMDCEYANLFKKAFRSSL